MNKYRLRAKYDTDKIGCQKTNNLLTVDIPMLELDSNELKYGLQHIKNKLYKDKIFPTELGFDLIALSTVVCFLCVAIRILAHLNLTQA